MIEFIHVSDKGTNNLASVSIHETRFYNVPPNEKTVEVCRSHGRDHAAYGWRKQIDPRWTPEQINAYREGYASWNG